MSWKDEGLEKFKGLPVTGLTFGADLTGNKGR
jgi:hypothetical protein